MTASTDSPPGIDALIDGVKLLTGSVQDLSARSRRNRLLIVVTGVGLTLDLALSGLFFAQHVEQTHTNNRIACQNELRSKTAAIADKDRKNIDRFFAAVVTVKTPQQFTVVYGRYLDVRNADDAARRALGNGKASTCG